MGASLAQLLTVRTPDQVFQQMMADAQAAGMPATGWQSWQIPRVLFQIESAAQATAEQTRFNVVSGGYLDLAAALVDPSWLYLLAAGFFNLIPSPATSTVGTLQLVSSAGIAAKPINVGDLWATSDSGLRYNNTTAGVVPANGAGAVGLTFKAESPGSAYNVGVGAISKLTTPLPGISISNPAIGSTGTWILAPGADIEANSSLVLRCKNRWGDASMGGNADAYAARIANAFISTGATPTITRWKIDDANPFGPGSVGVYLANAAGPATAGEVATVDAYLQPRKNLGMGQLKTSAANLFTQAVVATLFVLNNPNAASDAAAKLTAYQSTFPLGAIIFKEEIAAQLLQVNGSYNCILNTPTLDTQLAPTQVVVFSPTITIS